MNIRSSLTALKTSVFLLLLAPLIVHGEGPKPPPVSEIKTLGRHSLLAFNTAVQEKTFASFYNQEMARLFRDQISLEKFTSIFHPFFETEGFDISAIAKIEPMFDAPPAFDKDGALLVAGYYLTPPNKVAFKLEYFREKDGWKLTAINVKVSSSAETPPTAQNATKPASSVQPAATKLAADEQLESGMAALRWLELLDAQKYAENFDASSASFRKHFTAEVWAKNHASMKKQFGAVTSRDDKVDFKTKTSQEDDGKETVTYTVQFKTKFEKKSGLENVRMEKESGTWKVADYSITTAL